ncbi:MAG: N-6 DNA methylase [Clostridiales bacterium]|nr:N-6 DNA methylase [Clostridiales bacterium]
MAKIQSVEPNIADLANGWLRSYKLPYKLEQESLNTEIDQALNDYASKSGGAGGNRPDAKLFLQDKNLVNYPILIEYKEYKDKLVLLDADGRVANKTAKNQPDFKTINSYAVNGAVHYANALLHYTSYTEIIAIGMTGYKDDAGKLQYEIGVYYVSKSNFGVGQKVDDYTDFSFLKKENFDQFIETVKQLHLTPEEIEKLRERREQEINASLVKLNNDIYQNEKGLSERDRVYLVAASIIATLGVPGKVAALEKAELKSSTEDGNRDGDIILRKIKAFLNEKNLPSEKRDLIVRTLQNTLTTDNINKVENGESQLKRVFTKIIDDLGIYYKIGLSTDFTGKLFNEMYSWLGFSQDKLNDVVLTPSYVATLLARLARVNKDSYVWDFATGSAGLLVASMNEMLIDAKEKIKSPDELARKSAQIKATQLLGLEILSEVYMLAILNMILMGDGSSNIINKDSLKEFDGNYGFGKTDEKFPADAFVLNPPYSAPGNGMVFVERALSMMSKGYAAIIIQNSAGNGKAAEYNKRILQHSTLLASIKMPIDLFIGKSSVQTNVYVFRVGEAHQKDDAVKFIDFSNDGYTRSDRKKASSNLKDTDHAKERYQEVVDLYR